MPHQIAFLRWAKGRSFCGAFMQMRLGKSLSAIRWIGTRDGVSRALVVCPLSVVEPWVKEIGLERPHDRVVPVVGLDAADRAAVLSQPVQGPTWFVANKELLLSRRGAVHGSSLCDYRWDAVVLDESPCIRNPRSKTCKAALKHLTRARYRIALSGLPNPEGPEDYVPQMLFVRGGEFMGHRSFWSWRQEHMRPVAYGFSGWTVRGSSLGRLKAAVESDSFRMTRYDAGMPDLKVHETRYVTLPRRVMSAVRQARSEFRVGDRLTNSVLAVMTMEAQLAGGQYGPDARLRHDAKLAELGRLLEEELKGEQVVVWARFTAEIEAAAKMLRAKTIVGSTPADRRAEIIDAFNRGDERVIVVQPRCLSMGVDLSVASASVVLSNYYDLEVRSQMEDRLVHPKKREPVLIVDVVARGTIDVDVAEALTEKRATAATFNARVLRAVRRLDGVTTEGGRRD